MFCVYYIKIIFKFVVNMNRFAVFLQFFVVLLKCFLYKLMLCLNTECKSLFYCSLLVYFLLFIHILLLFLAACYYPVCSYILTFSPKHVFFVLSLNFYFFTSLVTFYYKKALELPTSLITKTNSLC